MGNSTRLPVFDRNVSSIVVKDNDAYVGGDFTRVAQPGSDQFVGFNSATGANLNLNIGDFNGTVRDFKVTSTAIYVVGDFTSWSGVDRKYVAKFDLDGNLDNSFNPGVNITGIGYGPYMLAVEVSGNSVYLGGYFTITSGGVSRYGICKLNSDTGALDPAFRGLNSGNSGINKIMLDPDGGLWITPDETYNSIISAAPGYCNYGRLVKLNANTGNPDFSQKWALQQVIVGINDRNGYPPPVGMTSSTMLISDVAESLGLRAAGGTILGSDFLPPGGADIGRVAKGHSQSSGTLDACFDGTNYWVGVQSAQDFRNGDGSFSNPKLYDNQSVTSLIKVNSSGDLLTDFSYPSMQSLMASIGVAQTGDTLRHYEQTTNVAYYGGSVYALTAGYTTSVFASNSSMSVLTKINPSTNSVVIKRRVDGPAGSTAFFIQNGRYLYFYGRPNHQHKSATGTSAEQAASVVQGGCLVEYDMETDAWRTILATLPGYSATTSIIYGLCYLDGYLYATGPLGVYKINVSSGAIDSTFNTNVLTSPLIAMRAIETDGTSIYLGLSGTYKTKTGVAKISAAGVLNSAFTSTLTSGQAVSLFYSGTLGNLAVSRGANIGIDFLNPSTGAKAYNKAIQGSLGKIKTVNGKVFMSMTADLGVYYPTDYATEFGSSLVNASTVWQIAKNWDGYSYYPGQLQQGISWIKGSASTYSISVNASQDKAYLAGSFANLTAYQSGTVSTRPKLAKINLANMTVDNTFVPASCSIDLSLVHCVGSNVYVSYSSGQTNEAVYNGTSMRGLFLVSGSDASLDQTFHAKMENKFMKAYGYGGSVSKIHYSGSGSVYCMGNFIGYGYQERQALAKVNLRTGVLDSKWLPQEVAGMSFGTTYPRALALSPDGKSIYCKPYGSTVGANLRRFNSYDGRAETVDKVDATSNIRVGEGKIYAIWGGAIGVISTGLSRVNKLVFGVSLYVGVGDNGQILTSADGATWTARTSGTTQHLYGVAYDGTGRFVAVGAGGVALTSVDGVTWQACSGAGSLDLNAITYANSLFVAVGKSGQVAKSSDGQTFSATSVTSEDLYDVFFGSSKFAAVGSNGKIITSGDTSVWTSRTSGVSKRLLGVSYGATTSAGSLFAAVGEGGVLLTSTDGVTWAAVSSGYTDTIHQASFFNGVLLIGGVTAARWTRNLSSWAVLSRLARACVYNSVTGKLIVSGSASGEYYGQLCNISWASGAATSPSTVASISAATTTSFKGPVRLFSTGLLDSAFDTVIGTVTVSSLAVSDAFPSGSFVYLVGTFTTWKGATHNRIVKVNASNAQVAAGWNAGTGLATNPTCVIVSQYGDVYVGSTAAITYQGVATGSTVVKLDSNGNRDANFAVTGIVDDIVEAKITNKFA